MGAEVLYNRDGDLSYLSVLVEESQGGLMGDSVRVVHEEYSEGFRQKSHVVSQKSHVVSNNWNDFAEAGAIAVITSGWRTIIRAID